MRVGVVGCSGTGSIMAELLARNGVGALVLVDDDAVEEKNLNRLVSGTIADARSRVPKVRALEKAIARAGLGTEVHGHRALTDAPEAWPRSLTATSCSGAWTRHSDATTSNV